MSSSDTRDWISKGMARVQKLECCEIKIASLQSLTRTGRSSIQCLHSVTNVLTVLPVNKCTREDLLREIGREIYGDTKHTMTTCAKIEQAFTSRMTASQRHCQILAGSIICLNSSAPSLT